MPSLPETLRRRLDKKRSPEPTRRRRAKDSVSGLLRKISQKKMSRWPLRSHRIRLSNNLLLNKKVTHNCNLRDLKSKRWRSNKREIAARWLLSNSLHYRQKMRELPSMRSLFQKMKFHSKSHWLRDRASRSHLEAPQRETKWSKTLLVLILQRWTNQSKSLKEHRPKNRLTRSVVQLRTPRQ